MHLSERVVILVATQHIVSPGRRLYCQQKGLLDV